MDGGVGKADVLPDCAGGVLLVLPEEEWRVSKKKRSLCTSYSLPSVGASYGGERKSCGERGGGGDGTFAVGGEKILHKSNSSNQEELRFLFLLSSFTLCVRAEEVALASVAAVTMTRPHRQVRGSARWLQSSEWADPLHQRECCAYRLYEESIRSYADTLAQTERRIRKKKTIRRTGLLVYLHCRCSLAILSDHIGCENVHRAIDVRPWRNELMPALP